MPRAFSIQKIYGNDNNRIILSSLYGFQIDPENDAIVTDADIDQIGQTKFEKGKVSIVSYEPNKISLATNFADKGFVVLADQYYPGWRAYIDGKETKIYKTNGILRGVVVTAGEHTIVFRYLPYKFLVSAGISLITLIAGMVFLIKKQNPK